MQPRILVAAIAAALAFAAPAHAATTAETANTILSGVAAHATHGFGDYGVPYDQLEAKMAEGGTVRVLCGVVSQLGIRALSRAGITARPVGAFSSTRADLFDVPAGTLESHAMIEVWTGARWELYDLDSNVQPVDENGEPVTIQQFAAMPARHYKPLADDPLYDPTGDQYPVYEAWVFANHEAWYDRVLDVVTILQGSQYIYEGDAPILAGVAGYLQVPDIDAWSAWPPPKPAQPAAASAPAPVAVAPAPTVPTTVAPVVTPDPQPAAPATVAAAPVVVKAKPRTGCTRARRCVTIRRRGRVYHVYNRGTRRARWVLVRKAT